MRGETIARNYASALFDLATREGEEEAYGVGLETVVGMLDEVPGFRRLLETPQVAAERKKDVLRDGFEGKIPAHVLNFLFLVLDRRRQRLFPEIAEAYRSLLDDRMERTRVDVRVARPLGEGEEADIAAELSRILGKTAIPRVRVQPELLGGIVFRSGDTIFDGSVRRGLQRMRHRLMTTAMSTDHASSPDGATDNA